MELKVDPKNIEITQDIREKWQKIVNILTKIMKVPSALIMRVDFPSFTVFQAGESDANPFKAGAEFKLPAGIYCEETMKRKDKMVIPNALKDPKWDKNPSIEVGMIAYCGFPIFYPNKEIFGTLCVVDNKENKYSKDFQDIMSQFKEIIESHLELLWQKVKLENLLEQQKATEEKLKTQIKETQDINRLCVDRELKMVELKERIEQLEKDLKQYRKEAG